MQGVVVEQVAMIRKCLFDEDYLVDIKLLEDNAADGTRADFLIFTKVESVSYEFQLIKSFLLNITKELKITFDYNFHPNHTNLLFGFTGKHGYFQIESDGYIINVGTSRDYSCNFSSVTSDPFKSEDKAMIHTTLNIHSLSIFLKKLSKYINGELPYEYIREIMRINR